MQDESRGVAPEPFFVAKEPRKFSFNRIFDLFKKKEEPPKARWIAFSKKIADAFTRQDVKEIAKQVDGSNVDVVEINKKDIDINLFFNVLFNVIGLPSFTVYYFLDILQRQGPEDLDLFLFPFMAAFSFYSFINSIKSSEYLKELKQKMIDEGLDELAVFVDMWQNRHGQTPKF